MRYLIITLLLIYTYSTSTSQNLSLLNYQTNAYKNVIGFKTYLGVGSSDVSWGFTKKLIQGGEISPELKDRAFTQLSDLNSGAGLWTIGLFYDLNMHLKLNSHFSIGGSTGIGGYNTFRIGLASDILLNKSCLIQLYTRSFFWAIQEKNPTSFIAGASIRKYF